MKKLLSHLIRTIVSLAIVAASVAVFLWLGKAEPPKGREIASPPPVVAVVSAAPSNAPLTFQVDGVVVPFRQIQIAAEVGGRVTFKSENCRTGRRVEKGEVLIRIDPTDYDLEIRRLTEERNAEAAQIVELESEIKATGNRIDALAEQLAIDERQTLRTEEMVRRQAASQSEFDTARRTELLTRNEYQTLVDQKLLLQSRKLRLEAARALAEANLDKAKLSLSRTELVAPIDGMVASDQVEQDGYVQSGTIVLTLQDIGQLDVACKIQMDQMNWLWVSNDASNQASRDSIAGDTASPRPADPEEPAQSPRLVSTEREPPATRAFPVTPARIRATIGGQVYQWAGRVDRYDGAGMDEQTRMVPCRVNVAQPDQPILAPRSRIDGKIEDQPTDVPLASPGIELLTGMYVSVLMDVSPPETLIRLPHSAVQPGNSVWTVRQGRLARIPIEVVSDDDDSVLVAPRAVGTSRALGTSGGLVESGAGGIQIDDQVVVSPLATPVEGTAVIIQGSPEEAAMLRAKRDAQSQAGGWGR